MNIAQNLPSIQTLTRRSLLAGLPAAAVAPAAMAALAADPHPRWLKEWHHLTVAGELAAQKPGAGDADTPECLALEARRMEIEDRLCEIPATTVAGAAAQLEWIAAEQDLGIFYEGHTRALHLAISTLQAKPS